MKKKNKILALALSASFIMGGHTISQAAPEENEGLVNENYTLAESPQGDQSRQSASQNNANEPSFEESKVVEDEKM